MLHVLEVGVPLLAEVGRVLVAGVLPRTGPDVPGGIHGGHTCTKPMLCRWHLARRAVIGACQAGQAAGGERGGGERGHEGTVHQGRSWRRGAYGNFGTRDRWTCRRAHQRAATKLV